jgi:hypothetical protein
VAVERWSRRGAIYTCAGDDTIASLQTRIDCSAYDGRLTDGAIPPFKARPRHAATETCLLVPGISRPLLFCPISLSPLPHQDTTLGTQSLMGISIATVPARVDPLSTSPANQWHREMPCS